MTNDFVLSAPEKWDEVAKKLKRSKGAWILVMETPENHRGQNFKTTEALERRGLNVEVRSRLGRGTTDRP